MSLRTRLIAAFTVLIVTSASATIAIGNVVFGQKVTDQALSLTEVGLSVVDDHLRARLRCVEEAASASALMLDHPFEDRAETCQRIASLEAPVEFVFLVRGDLTLLARPAGSSAACGPREMTTAPTWRADLAELVADASNQPTSGFVVLDASERALVGYDLRTGPGRQIFLLAAAPLRGGGHVVVGAHLKREAKFIAAPLAELWPGHDNPYVAHLFLANGQIIDARDDGANASEVDAETRQAVLIGGERHLGFSVVGGREIYAGTAPLRDHRGQIIGGVAVGSERAVYADLKNRTVTLFSTLIAAGMIFGLVMTYVFTGWLVRPIVDLATGMDRVASGDFNYKVRYRSADELGKLTRAFNRMVKNVKDRDIRLREMTEERLSQMEKQVSIGRLAAGVAHEINNPLTSVLSLSMMMRKHMEDDDPERENLDIVVEETTRCRAIVRSLLDFARERPVESSVLEIHEVLRDTLTLTCRYDGMDRVEMVFEESPEPLHVSGDPKQLQQVFTNLITNAAEAMEDLEERRRLTVRIDEDSSGGYVLVHVIDEGKGMSTGDLERAFEPFFTTKGVRRGTGLGLSVSLGIVRKHHGTIELDSTEGEGTTVTVHLPRVDMDSTTG